MAEANKYLDQYRINTSRLQQYDYGANGGYFVTIKTHQMNHYLGTVVKTSHGTSLLHSDDGKFIIDKLQITNTPVAPETRHGASILLSPIGQMVHEYWQEIPKHFPFVRLDTFQIMPNHVHGILFFEKEKSAVWEPNVYRAMQGKLGTIMNLYKGAVTKYAKDNAIEFRWHPRYYDSVLRGDNDVNTIRNYIHSNPINWLKKNSKEE